MVPFDFYNDTITYFGNYIVWFLEQRDKMLQFQKYGLTTVGLTYKYYEGHS